MMRLVRLIYASKPVASVDFGLAKQIQLAAKNTNELLGITGILFYDRTAFVQCLEGGRNQVNQLYHKIAADPRHEQVEILEYREIDQREFTQWAMGLVTAKEANREVFLRYCGKKVFNPFEISSNAALGFLKDLREKILD